MPPYVRPLVFFDTETTGFDPRKHEIIDAWAVRVDADTLDVKAEGGGRVVPTRFHTASRQALYKNGYDAAVWARDARPWREVWEDLQPVLHLAQLVGSNPTFDVRFLAEQNRRHGLPILDIRYPVDTAVLAHLPHKRGALPGCSLDVLCDHFGITEEQTCAAHTARGDCYRALEVYRRLRGGLAWKEVRCAR